MGRPLKMITAEELFREKRVPYTAFLNLKPPAVEEKVITKPNGTTQVVLEGTGADPLPQLLVLPASAPLLHKLRHEQVLEGFAYLHGLRAVGPLELYDGYTFFALAPYWSVVANTYQTAAKLEEQPADRVLWYEARIRVLKEFERVVKTRVANKQDPPQYLDLLRFRRLGTEADLLRLKAEVERIGPTTGSPPLRETFAYKGPRPFFTAFPNLKPPTIETGEFKNSDGVTQFAAREKDGVPLPRLPTVTGAPVLQKARLEQIRIGLSYLEHLSEVIRIGSWTAQSSPEYLEMVSGVYRCIAELENVPAKRIPWYEARVRTLKEFERFTETRVQNRTDMPQQLNNVHIHRLRAEAELLVLKAEVAKPQPAPMYVYPPACGRSCGGLLPRLFPRR
jgi:hypothetical protein